MSNSVIRSLLDWVKSISPMYWVGRVPLESASALALVCALVVALTLAAVALGAFRDARHSVTLTS